DRVAIEPSVPCHTCQVCKEGRYNLCKDLKFFAVPPYQGSLCRLFNHRANFCFKLPDHISFEEAALLEPLSVVVHACRRAGVAMGNNVLVCGAGPIGLLTLLTAKACGATIVTITDLDEGRLAKAKELGADYTIKVESRDGKEVAKKVMEAMGPADKTIECTGVESSIHTGIYFSTGYPLLVLINYFLFEATKSGGIMALVGLEENEIKIPIVEAIVHEVDLRGVFAGANCYPAALALVASGAVNVKPLITHHFKMGEFLEAFETSRTGAGGAIKVIIHCNE
ncbi:hypothetical protein QZH41_010483, partial [Actinostola sp. cb2023]